MQLLSPPRPPPQQCVLCGWKAWLAAPRVFASKGLGSAVLGGLSLQRAGAPLPGRAGEPGTRADSAGSKRALLSLLWRKVLTEAACVCHTETTSAGNQWKLLAFEGEAHPALEGLYTLVPSAPADISRREGSSPPWTPAQGSSAATARVLRFPELGWLSWGKSCKSGVLALQRHLQEQVGLASHTQPCGRLLFHAWPNLPVPSSCPLQHPPALLEIRLGSTCIH